MSDHEFDRKAFDERDPGELLAAVAQLLDREANAMPIPPWSGAPRHLIMTIVPRRGFTVVGVDERRWLSGWYCSNHATAALTSDIAVVTEHGLTEFMSGWGGREPSWSSRHDGTGFRHARRTQPWQGGGMRSHCALYVDAGYLLAAIATRLTGTSLRSGIEPNHEALVRQLCEHAETKSGLPLLRVHWYDSARHGRPDPTQEQIGLLPRVKVRLGRIGYEGEQKGVDLRIGLDMVAHARNGAVDVMYLVSGDDDLTEAVEEAQAHGVQVTVLAVPTRHGGPHGVSKHLQRAADGLDLLAETLDATVASTAASIAATIAAAPVTEEEPVEQKPPVPSPAMFAQRTLTAPKHAAGPPVPVKKPADIVYSSSTGGMHVVAHEYQHSPAEYAEIIDAVVERVLTSWQTTASAEQREGLTGARPSIPREIDRALLHDASDALGMYDLNDSVRYQLRTRFWVVAEKLAN